jgi:hypothetical protein
LETRFFFTRVWSGKDKAKEEELHSEIDSSFIREDDVQYMGGKSEGGRKQNKKQE